MKAGTAIVFRNRDDIPHSVGAKGAFHSKAIDTDDSFSFHLCEAWKFLRIAPQNARQDRGHAVRRKESSIPREIRNFSHLVSFRDPIVSFEEMFFSRRVTTPRRGPYGSIRVHAGERKGV
jgi:hypothetical protein